jgi:transposase
MRHPKELKKEVLEFLAKGGSQAAAARHFKLSRTTVRIWIKQPEGYEAQKPGPRGSHKFDRAELKRLIQERPDLLLREIAQHFNVSLNAISHALKRMNIRRRKRYAMSALADNDDS